MKYVALCSLVLLNFLRPPAPAVRVRGGAARGRVSDDGRVHEYLGLPYATVDQRNRFQAPLPPPTWDGVFDAQNENSWCPQAVLSSSLRFGQTDCLKLNVYTPAHRPDRLLPVMVFIHGGCFFGGSGSPFLYGGDYFSEQGVVFVAINYRLSVEGFLCLGIKEAPGNAGLKDQVAALKWIRDNIHAFGGNKDDVTLFGESAGAVSTSLLMLSDAAEGLFHKVILQSGSSLSPWGLQHDPIKTAINLVNKLGYNATDPKEIHRILSQKSALDLISVLKYNQDRYCVADENLFVPCVEKEIEGVEPIITEHPAKIIEAGNFTKLPMIIGHTDQEGVYFVSADHGTSLPVTSEIDVLKNLQRDLEFPNESEKNSTVEKIKGHYFSSLEDEMMIGMVDLYSDVHFKCPLLIEAEMYGRWNDQPMYYYLFRYSGLVNIPKITSGFWWWPGASHADELFYLFRPHAIQLPFRFWENDMVKRMVMLWTNFAKFGDPTPSANPLLPFRWRPSREWNPTALVLDSRPTTAPLWHTSSLALWNDTYNKYRRRDYGFKEYEPKEYLRESLKTLQ